MKNPFKKKPAISEKDIGKLCAIDKNGKITLAKKEGLISRLFRKKESL